MDDLLKQVQIDEKLREIRRAIHNRLYRREVVMDQRTIDLENQVESLSKAVNGYLLNQFGAKVPNYVAPVVEEFGEEYTILVGQRASSVARSINEYLAREFPDVVLATVEDTNTFVIKSQEA